MFNPWNHIPIADYEAHMGLPSVAQSALLAATLHKTVNRFQPRSLALLGAAGGNGLELVDPVVVRRVVALDINAHYLDVCTSRYAARFCEFEPVTHDLSQGPPIIAPVECIFAGLVLEYLLLDRFYSYLPSLVTDGGIFATVLQLPSADLPEISISPFATIATLDSVFSFFDPADMHVALLAKGFSRVDEELCDLDTGKSFCFVTYQYSRHAIA